MRHSAELKHSLFEVAVLSLFANNQSMNNSFIGLLAHLFENCRIISKILSNKDCNCCFSCDDNSSFTLKSDEGELREY